MFECHKKSGNFEFFAEKRLIFGGSKKPSGGKESGASEGLEKDIDAQLAAMRSGAPVPGAKPSKKVPAYSTKRENIRTITPTIPNYRESVIKAEKLAMMKGYMHRDEVLQMQSAHEDLYVQYMNPDFMQYLRQLSEVKDPESNKKVSGLNEKVYEAIDLVLKNPEHFEYLDKGNERIEIIKRRIPHKPRKPKKGAEFSKIPKDFLIVMETKERHITSVRSTGVNKQFKKGSDIPWLSNKEYNKKMPLFRARWMASYKLHRDEARKNLPLTQPKRNEAWRNTAINAFKDIKDTSMKDLFALDNIEFPKRFVAMVKARGLDFELTDPQFLDVVANQDDQGETYKEITEDGELYVVVTADPDIPGAYQISTADVTLRVDDAGFILRESPDDGKWRPDPRYHKAVLDKYYRDHPDAIIDLPKSEAKEVKGLGKKTSDIAESNKKQVEIQKKREEVDEALNKADLETLKKVAKSMTTNKAHHDNIDRIDDIKWFLDRIGPMLDADPSKVEVVAKILEEEGSE